MRIFTLFISLFAIVLLGAAQTTPESSQTPRQYSQTILELSKKENPKRKVYLKQGKKIQYRLAKSKKFYKGRIDQIKDSSLVINGVELDVNFIEELKAKGLKLGLLRKAPQSILYTSSGIAGVAGIIFSIFLIQGNDPFTGIFIFYFMFFFTALPLLFIGLIFLLISSLANTKFDLVKDWNVKKLD